MAPMTKAPMTLIFLHFKAPEIFFFNFGKGRGKIFCKCVYNNNNVTTICQMQTKEISITLNIKFQILIHVLWAKLKTLN